MAGGFFGGITAGQTARQELDEKKELRFLKERGLDAEIADRQEGRSLQRRQLDIQERRAKVLNQASQANITREKQTEIRDYATKTLEIGVELAREAKDDAQRKAIADQLGGTVLNVLRSAGMKTDREELILQSIVTMSDAVPVDVPFEQLTPEQKAAGVRNDTFQKVEEDGFLTAVYDTRFNRLIPVGGRDAESAGGGVTPSAAGVPAAAEAAEAAAPALREEKIADAMGLAGFGANLANSFAAAFGGPEAYFTGQQTGEAVIERIKQDVSGVLRSMTEGREIAQQTKEFLNTLPGPNEVFRSEANAIEKYNEAAFRINNIIQSNNVALRERGLTSNKKAELKQQNEIGARVTAALDRAIKAMKSPSGGVSTAPFILDNR